MRNQIVTPAIILKRTNYGEADRIITFLTPEHGKLSAIAKGARRPKSKLAGGIELLSINDFTYLPGRRDLGTIISSRMHAHYQSITKDIHRTMLSYELLKKINKITEDAAGEEYFLILQRTLAGLNEPALSADISDLWFNLHLLSATGHMMNLRTDQNDQALVEDEKYNFDFSSMSFNKFSTGIYQSNHIKLLRLVHQAQSPVSLKNLKVSASQQSEVLKLVKSLLKEHTGI